MGSNNGEDSEVESSVKDEHELSIDPQGPSSVSSSPSCENSPSVSQAWSPTISSLDCGPLLEFRDWDPTSQISQFVNDLNYVPTDLAPKNVLESHKKEDTKGGNYGEQCKLENPDDSLAFHEVYFLGPDPSQELPDVPAQSTPFPNSLSPSLSSFQHSSHHGVTLRVRQRARQKAMQLSKEINLLSSLRARLMRKHRKLVMISHLYDSD